MSSDRDTLIEFYKTTLEEVRHHERIYWQTFIGLVIVTTIFLAAITFLLGKDTPLCSAYIDWVKGGIWGSALLVTLLFCLALYRVDSRIKVSLKVIREIEDRLHGVENTAESSELDGLLVRRELDKIKFDKWFARIRFWVYIPVIVAAFIALWYLLFRCIGS